MNKAELVEQMAHTSGLIKKDAERALSAFIEIIKNTLKKEEKVSLVGFGTFQVMNRKATTGINPKTKQTIAIPGKKVAKLKFSDSVNQILNK